MVTSSPGEGMLIGCDACGARISLVAVACPKCGHPRPRRGRWGRPLRATLVLLGLAAAFTVERSVEASIWATDSERADDASASLAAQKPPLFSKDYAAFSDRRWAAATHSDEVRAEWNARKEQRAYGLACVGALGVLAGILALIRRRAAFEEKLTSGTLGGDG